MSLDAARDTTEPEPVFPYRRTYLDVPIDRVVPAPWNYKKDATPEQMGRLKASILRDASAGALAVREIQSADDQPLYEVIDGNHRYVAVVELGWWMVHVENFGSISQAEAATVALRRNHQWMEDDEEKRQRLIVDVIAPAIPPLELKGFMPDGALVAAPSLGAGSMPRVGGDSITFNLAGEAGELWREWYKQAVAKGCPDQQTAFLYLLKALF